RGRVAPPLRAGARARARGRGAAPTGVERRRRTAPRALRPGGGARPHRRRRPHGDLPLRRDLPGPPARPPGPARRDPCPRPATPTPHTPAPPVAVLAGSAEVPYPAGGRRLHEEVARRGAVVSELPPGTVARRWCFVARNRIIAALSAVTVIVQATERSGSLT